MSKDQLVLLSILFAFIGGVQLLRPIDDLDLFFQIRLGLEIFNNGRLLQAEPLSALVADSGMLSFGWLAQVIFAFLYLLGGFFLITLVYALLLAVTYLLPVLNDSSGKRFVALSLASSLAFLVGLSNSAARPQGIALVSFALLVLVLENRTSLLKSLAIFLPMGLIWSNSHSSTSLGVALLGCYFISSLATRDFRNCVTTFILGMLLFLAQFMTPVGLAVTKISTSNLLISRTILGVSEWLPPWDPSVSSAMLGFWIALAISCCSMLLLFRKLNLKQALVFLLFTSLSLYAARFAIFFAIAMIPVWADWFERLIPKHLFCFSLNPQRRALPRVLGVFVALSLLFGPRLLAKPSMFNPEIPVVAISELQQQLPQGIVYNYREWSGPLVLLGSPDWRVTIDGRLYQYPLEAWKSYVQAARGEVAVDELERQYALDAFFLRASYHPALIKNLEQHPAWRQIYRDDLAVVFVKATKVEL